MVKKTLVAIGVVVPLLACLDAAPARLSNLVGRTFQARVVGVIDGDTLDVLKSDVKRSIRLRLDGIDAPESGEPFSRQAKNLTRVLSFDQQVTVIGKDVDRYGRLVARVLVGSSDVSVSLVSSGLACHFLKYSDDQNLAAAEARAKAAKLGFWAPDAQKPRCVAMNKGPSAINALLADGFFGNTNSRVYHSATCKNAHCKNCTQQFSTRTAAEQAGFKPAKDCLK